MSRNTSILLLVGFSVVFAICGSIFWHIESGAGDDLQKSLEKSKLVAAQTGMASSPDAAAASTQPVASGAQADSAGALTNPENDNASSAEEKKADSPVGGDTADWKTYHDLKNNFEFKYPTDVTVSSNADIITLSKGEVVWGIRVYEDKKNLDLQSWYLDYFSERERKNCTLLESSAVKVATYETKYASPGTDPTICERDGYFSTDSNKKAVLRISLNKESTEDANKILATLKFGS